MTTKEDLILEIGMNIDSVLREYGMTQGELADEIGVSRQLINAYIRGERMPTIINLINIAYVLECDISELIMVDDFVI